MEYSLLRKILPTWKIRTTNVLNEVGDIQIFKYSVSDTKGRFVISSNCGQTVQMLNACGFD